MKKSIYILSFSLSLFIFSCGNDENKEEVVVSDENAQVSYSQLPAITSISKEKLAEINKWKKFKELSSLMEKFQRQNTGDLTYYAEEFIRLDKDIEKDTLFPAKFEIPDVKSRLIVFNTFSNQLKVRLEENAPIDSINITRKRVMMSYNALRDQLSESLKSKIYEDFINNTPPSKEKP
ncbi:hypothetical protein [Joostella sp.]|uniref:hypothetical protein n=1 Tax=Joostella sp. TaxID=2231138 RepID=UPI003A95ACC6